ncbi:hypothetical protein [Streptomyces longisporus]|uniref:Transposase n=1 Tax=Streptomyces longisporus TaxID=1948 RepID=A0ABN3LHQ4_STRLO
MTEIARLTGEFGHRLTTTEGNDSKLTAAVNAAPALPHHNGRTEGVNTRTKRITR